MGGGTSALKNPNPYDPFQQYRLHAGPGWHHLTICGRLVTPSDPTRGVRFPISFYNEGQKQAICEVVLYADAAQTKFAKFRIGETQPYDVTDTYTKQTHQVTGLSDPNTPKSLKAERFPHTVITPDKYCEANRSGPDIDCKGKLRTPQALDSIEAYVGVSDDTCLGKPLQYDCGGKPLTTLIVPPAPGH